MVTGSTTMTTARATMHARSLPLALTSVTLIALLFCEMAYPHSPYPQGLVPGVAYLVTFLIVRAIRPREPMGVRVPYGVLALVLLALGIMPLVGMFAGAPFLLGLGLVTLGIRDRDAWLWVPGIALMVLSPLMAFWTIENHLGLNSESVLGALVVAFAGLGGSAWRREREILTAPVWPVGSAI
ncbi:hypothetical protein Bcav_0387 [Beutenbergia cavernae DSM 12333]|uniref:Uncharacterized protein n=1 Tax=Beutenbergia cavernae (strain ATCC BAA-8 / DSM 12333 / CCUG 43141 / JCM 11478 / NBRC 16432 / NCIMB 13614 / HKI 0122) TaxID=471853 RepID=C5BWJ3_BEUC1|nr:hypothetical protein [Beutenbergia cavernae]ACQ78651.1 hypothetical protein Bcav_0387 [Beutenbergia cavernae DSM 12333]